MITATRREGLWEQRTLLCEGMDALFSSVRIVRSIQFNTILGELHIR